VGSADSATLAIVLRLLVAGRIAVDDIERAREDLARGVVTEGGGRSGPGTLAGRRGLLTVDG
jgi:hypothetical protein